MIQRPVREYFTHIRASPLSLDDSGENTSSVHLLAGKKVTCHIKCGTIKIPLCSVFVCMLVSPLKNNFCSLIIIHSCGDASQPLSAKGFTHDH